LAAPRSPAALTPYRAADPFDWDAALALIVRAFAAMEGRIDPPSSIHHFTVQDLQAGEFWVIGTPPIACLLLTPKPHALYLGKLAVEPGQTRQGLARALIAMAETRARALGLPALELQTRVELTENHATFGALGFQDVARTAHAGFDRPTSITFRKYL
jgi:GNAT superfamily N-acetyltransferase